MRWKILLLVVLMTCSCASTHKIYQNGFPVPQESDTFCDMSSSFCANFVFDTKYEESEDSVYSRHFPLGEKITLPADTLSVALNLWVRNQKGWRYRVYKTVEVDGRTVTKQLYSGKAFDKRWQLTGPIIPGATVRIQATVYLGKTPLFTTMSAYYTCRIEKGGEIETGR